MENPESYLHNSTQLIMVNATDWNTHQAKMQWFERTDPDHKWEPYNESFDVVMGKKGLVYGLNLMPVPEGITELKKEGDMKT